MNTDSNMRKLIAGHDLKKNKNKIMSKDKTVKVVRDDGKEFEIAETSLAEHINRGNFKVKNSKDQPSDAELANAVGWKGDAPEAKDLPREPQRAETYVKEVVAKKPEGEAKEAAEEQINKDAVDSTTLKKAGVKKSAKKAK